MQSSLLQGRRSLLYSMAISLFLLLFGCLQVNAQEKPDQIVDRLILPASSNHQAEVDPLPPGCIHGTPAGEDAAVCCISGYVLLAGQPISNAVVTIATAQGIVAQVQTTRQDPTLADPYYRIDLAHLSQPITPTDVITISASYEGMSSPKVRYTVQPGGQQLNLVIYDPNPNALTLSGQTQGQGEPGKFINPYDVATDRWGNLYSIDFNRRVQVFDPQGNLLARPNWAKGYGDLPNQLSEPTGIAIDQRLDRVYIADGRNRRVGVYTTDGDLLALWDGKNTDDHQQFGYPRDVTVDDQGNVYVLAQQSPHMFYKFDSAGNFLKQWGTYGTGADQLVYPQQIAVTSAGEIVVTDHAHVFGSDLIGRDTIKKFDNVGTPLPFTVTFPGALASSAVISQPTGIAAGLDGSIYVFDIYPNPAPSGFSYAGRVLQMNAQGVVTRAWNYPTLDPDPFKRLSSAYGMNVYGDTLFVAGYAHNNIFRLNLAAGGFRESWGNIARNAGQIAQPHGIALAPAASPWAGSLFMADCTIARLSRIVDNVIVQSWDMQTAGSPSVCAWNIAFDLQGKLYTVDIQQNLLFRYVINDTQLVVDGGPWSGMLTNHDRAGIAIDQNNRIYLTEPSANTVSVFQLTSSTTFTKLASYAGNSQPPGPLKNPKALAIDDSDLNAVLVYVADTENGRMLVLKYANGAFSYQDSWGHSAFTRVCGNKNDTTLSGPLGVAVDRHHAIYVADTGENRVVKFDTAGNCVGQFGSLAPGPDQMA